MSSKTRCEDEPDWLNPANDRKTPFTDAELDRLASDFLTMNKDVEPGHGVPWLSSANGRSH